MTSGSPHLGPEWQPGPDGLLWRAAARVLLLDEQDRVLLVRGHDVDNPRRTWWFTIGGGIDPGESPRAAAVREVAEETGLRISQDELLGPVLRRSAVFDFQREHVRQDEEFFLARVAAPERLSTAGWTAIERSFMDEARWWDLRDLEQVQVEVFPAGLAHLLRELLVGWDGRVRHLGTDDGVGEGSS